jgi:hypothetical protein
LGRYRKRALLAAWCFMALSVSAVYRSAASPASGISGGRGKLEAQVWAERYNGPANESDYARALGMSPVGSMVFVTGFSSAAPFNYDYATVG